MKNIYIDMANLSAECKLKSYNIDYEKFFVWFSDKYKYDNIFLFTGFLEKYTHTYEVNKIIGYKYFFKEAVFNKDENKIKANCDVDIAIHGTIDTIENNLNEAILVTSDGDFASLVKFWKERSVKVRIISPADGERCSYLLKKDNNSVTYLSQIIDKITKENLPSA